MCLILCSPLTLHAHLVLNVPFPAKGLATAPAPMRQPTLSPPGSRVGVLWVHSVDNRFQHGGSAGNKISYTTQIYRGVNCRCPSFLTLEVCAEALVEGQTLLLPAGKLSARDKEILAGIGPWTYRTYPVRAGETVGVRAWNLHALTHGRRRCGMAGACFRVP